MFISSTYLYFLFKWSNKWPLYCVKRLNLTLKAQAQKICFKSEPFNKNCSLKLARHFLNILKMLALFLFLLLREALYILEPQNYYEPKAHQVPQFR